MRRAPSIIVARTHIGFGSPNKQDSSKAHGSPLGDDEVRATKESLRLAAGREVSRTGRGARPHAGARERGARWQREWEQRFDAYAKAFPSEAQQFRDAVAGKLPAGWDAALPTFSPDDKESRHAWHRALS